MLGQDQAPRMDLDLETDRVTRVRINRHFVGITSSSAVEFALHDVTRCVGMSAGVLDTIDPLREDAALGQRVHRIDDRLHEVRPTRNLRTEGMGQINEYFLPMTSLLLLFSLPVRLTGATQRPDCPCVD